MLALLLSFMLAAPATPPDAAVERFAFGSCLQEKRPAPIFDAVVDYDPDVLILLGDNVYADTDDPAEMKASYAALGAMPAYAKLRESARVLYAWDDHDYGKNDAGVEWPFKWTAKTIMLDFFGEPADSPRRTREGNYDSVTVGPDGQRVQVILLDTRWFRSPMQLDPEADRKSYVASDDPLATVLGDEQWTWLAERLDEPAELRLICSSIQVIADNHRFEKWGNFPAERERMLDAVAGASGTTVILSGDRHSGEFLRTAHNGVDVLELTASALNQTRGLDESDRGNPYRVGDPVTQPNAGTLDINWAGKAATFRLVDATGEMLEEVAVPLR